MRASMHTRKALIKCAYSVSICLPLNRVIIKCQNHRLYMCSAYEMNIILALTIIDVCVRHRWSNCGRGSTNKKSTTKREKYEAHLHQGISPAVNIFNVNAELIFDHTHRIEKTFSSCCDCQWSIFVVLIFRKYIYVHFIHYMHRFVVKCCSGKKQWD